MRDASRVRAVALAALLVLSVVAGVASPALASSAADPPSGMVGVPSSNVGDLRPDELSKNVTESDLEGNVYVSNHASTTNVSIVTRGQAVEVANGASPAQAARKAVCSSPAAGKNPNFDCAVDDQFALVISDDAFDAGRKVAVRTSVLKEALGYVPRQITVANNETGETWDYVAERKNGWLVASVEHFSSNSVTWSGSVNITGSPASDGSSYSYEIADLDAASDPTINLTGVTNSEWDNVTETGVSNGDSIALDVSGNKDPTGTSGVPTVTFHGKSSSSSHTWSRTGDSGGISGSFTVGGNLAPTNAQLTVTPQRTKVVGEFPTEAPSGSKEYTVSSTESLGEFKMDVTSLLTSQDITVDFDPDQDGTYEKSKTKYVSYDETLTFTFTGSWTTSGNVDVRVDPSASTESDWSAENPVSYGPYPGDVDVTIGGTTYNFNSLTSQESTSISLTEGESYSPSYTQTNSDGSADVEVTWTENTGTENPSIDVGNDGSTDASYSGVLESGESVTYNLSSVTTDTDTAELSLDGGTVDVTVRLKEHTVSKNSSIELNGEVYQHDGTLNDGETVQLTANESDLVDGTNTVNVSVGDGTLSADAPDPVVGFTYTHNASDSQSVNYVGGTWIERYNVTKQYSSDRQNPTLTIPFQSDMAKMNRLEYRVNGGTWKSPIYSFDGTTLTVELPDVQAGDEVTVVANGTAVSTNGEVKVLEPTPPGQRLDSKIKVTELPNSGDFYVDVGGTDEGDRVHYLYSESWSADEHSIIEADGTNKVVAPNVVADGTARVTTWPVKVEPNSGAVVIDATAGSRSEPGVSVGPSVDGETTVQYTFPNAEDGTKYNLYSEQGIVRDSGTASSPLTLEDDDSDETLLFKKENTSSETSDSDQSDDPVQRIGQYAQEQTSGFSTFGMLGMVGLGLVGIVGAVVVVRRRRDDDVGSSSAAGGVTAVAGGLTSGLRAILGQLVGLLRWFVTHPKMTGALLVFAGIAAVLTGAVSLPPGTGILIIAVGVPLLTYFAMRKLDRFNPLVFGTVSMGAILLALQLLGGNLVESFLNALGPGALILALAALYVLYRAIRAYQSAASAPEEVNQINIGDDGND